MPQDGNYHQYNHKVLYATIIKDKQGGYSYKMGINCYRLDKDKDYTLCIEILNSDYQLWHKSVATIDKTTSFLTGTQIVVGTLSICIISK